MESGKKSATRALLFGILNLIVLVSLFLATPGFAISDQGARELASAMFQRLAGYSLPLDDARRVTMENDIKAGNLSAAAHVATQDDDFINVTIRQWAMPMSNREETRLPSFKDGIVSTYLNDFVATVMGAVRDGADARILLTDDLLYIVDVNNADIASLNIKPWNAASAPFTHYESADIARLNGRRLDLKKYLIKFHQEAATERVVGVPNVAPLGTKAAGLLTTHAWGAAHLYLGTNRRAVAMAFKEFLCTEIHQLIDTTVADDRVRRDVDRAPGGVPATYQNTCRGCHAGIDALAGAYAYFDGGAVGQTVRYYAPVQSKMNKNANIYPNGYVTVDDSFKNYWNAGKNATLLGFGSNSSSGTGVSDFGRILANTDAFALCMARRTFRDVCGIETVDTDGWAAVQNTSVGTAIKALGDGFQKNYNLQTLFEQTAARPECLGVGK